MPVTERQDTARIARGLFIVWGPPSKGPRSAVLGRDLGLEVAHLASDWRAGFRDDPLKYPRMAWRTVRLLLRRRPRVVFVQSPPTPAVWLVAAYSLATGATYVIDAHSDAFERARWTRPQWLNRLLARQARATLVTDAHWADRVRSQGAHAIVIPDIPREPDPGAAMALPPGFHVMVVNTWAVDEPLDAVLRAARDVPDATFHVTGKRDDRFDNLADVPPNVLFTGFLDHPDYVALMRAVDAVMCLTTRDHTMQRGACEALALARPIITSDTALLRDYFARGTVHVNNTSAAIRGGIGEMMRHYGRYATSIRELRDLRFREWTVRRAELVELATRHDRRATKS